VECFGIDARLPFSISVRDWVSRGLSQLVLSIRQKRIQVTSKIRHLCIAVVVTYFYQRITHTFAHWWPAYPTYLFALYSRLLSRVVSKVFTRPFTHLMPCNTPIVHSPTISNDACLPAIHSAFHSPTFSPVFTYSPALFAHQDYPPAYPITIYSPTCRSYTKYSLFQLVYLWTLFTSLSPTRLSSTSYSSH
jgi:hypothetical protein